MMLFDRVRDDVIARVDTEKYDNGNYKNVTHLFHLFSVFFGYF